MLDINKPPRIVVDAIAAGVYCNPTFTNSPPWSEPFHDAHADLRATLAVGLEAIGKANAHPYGSVLIVGRSVYERLMGTPEAKAETEAILRGSKGPNGQPVKLEVHPNG